MKHAAAVLVAWVVLTAPAHAQVELRATVGAWVTANQRAIVKELLDVLAIPNVAADRASIRKNAVHLQRMLASRGFAAEVLDTSGNPLVYGDLRVPGATRTLLLYSHYDGQPVDAKAWRQPAPLKPILRSGRLDQNGKEIADIAAVARFEPDWRIYGRSSSDDKAPIVAMCAALDALKAAKLSPSWNVRVVLDGEEEVSSPSLVPAIAKYQDKLRADLMVILDGPIHSSGRPTIAYGARGIVTMNLTVYGPRAGVHSGNYGNWIPNPAQRLATLLASMKGDDGRVLVKGFYDGISPLSGEERALLAAVPDDRARMLETFGVKAPETAFQGLQDALQYPTLNVRGLSSAHVGAGARTIIPDRAIAAIDLRLVKETKGADLVEKLRAHVRSQGFFLADGEPDAQVRAAHDKIASLAVTETITEAFRTAVADPHARRVVDALRATFGSPPVQLRTLGGTVPIAPFIESLGFPAILAPTVNFDNNQHEENESLRLGHLFQAIEIVAAILRS